MMIILTRQTSAASPCFHFVLHRSVWGARCHTGKGYDQNCSISCRTLVIHLHIEASCVCAWSGRFLSSHTGNPHPFNCKRARDQRSRKQSACGCSAPKYNPQNVPDPQVLPQKCFSPEEAVRAQLDALQKNNHPW